MPADELIRLEKATLRVGGRWILPDTSWAIKRGENWVVLGPNGSGKTSLTAALTGDVPVVAGHRRINQAHLRAQDMARLSFETHQRLIARDEALDEARGFAGIDDPGILARSLLEKAPSTPETLSSVIHRLNLDAILCQPVRSLSTGEIRRLLIGRALLSEPRLLILDEPFDGLDAAMRDHLARLIESLIKNKLQVVLVTHRQEEIVAGMTHCLVLGDRQVIRKGELTDVSLRAYLGEGGHYGHALKVPTNDRNAGAGNPAEDRQPMIRMDGVSVVYNERRVLKRLDWSVYPGENWLISGPNGAGKSTLLRLISADHLQAYANAIFIFGRRRGSGESIWEIKQRIGMVSTEFQVRYRQPLSGYDVVLSGFFDSVGLFRLADKDQRQRARDWMADLRIEHLAEDSFPHMSNGQRRMILIARAMVKSPDVLILDEPCQGLDTANRKRVLSLIDHIGTQTATSLIYTTHHADERPVCMTHEMRLAIGGAWDCRRLDRHGSP
jgi:molybdate transport system ATP-binding protein